MFWGSFGESEQKKRRRHRRRQRQARKIRFADCDIRVTFDSINSMRDVNEVHSSLRNGSEPRAGHGGDVCMETVGDVSVDVDGVVSMSDRNSSLGNTATDTIIDSSFSSNKREERAHGCEEKRREKVFFSEEFGVSADGKPNIFVTHKRSSSKAEASESDSDYGKEEKEIEAEIENNYKNNNKYHHTHSNKNRKPRRSARLRAKHPEQVQQDIDDSELIPIPDTSGCAPDTSGHVPDTSGCVGMLNSAKFR